MSYKHTQHAPWIWFLLPLALVTMTAMLAWSGGKSPDAVTLRIVGGVIVLIACCFERLTVRDAGASLSVRFGLLPLLGTKIDYSAITGVETARSDLLDGWGIHYVPGRGRIYNLWGFDCVRIRMGGKTVRIGTDDVNGLVRFLRGKIASAG